MRAVDTNVLVRLLTGDDPKQVEVAEEFISKGAWTSHVVLVETIWVLASAFGLDHNAIVLSVQMLLNHRDITIQDADIVEAALDQYRRKPSLGFSDCLVLEIARGAGHLPLGTFDRGLGKLDSAERLETPGKRSR